MTIEQCLSISRDLGIAACYSGDATLYSNHASFLGLLHDRSNGFGARDRTLMIGAWRSGYDLASTNFDQR